MGKKEACCTQNSPLKATSICVVQGNENSIEGFDLIGLGYDVQSCQSIWKVREEIP